MIFSIYFTGQQNHQGIYIIFYRLSYKPPKIKQIYLGWVIDDVQGVRLEPSKSYCLLLPKYEQKGFFKHTRGSPDVVHLIKKPS